MTVAQGRRSSSTSRPAAAATAIRAQRDPGLVREDMADGKITPAYAYEHYGIR